MLDNLLNYTLSQYHAALGNEEFKDIISDLKEEAAEMVKDLFKTKEEKEKDLLDRIS